MEPASSIVRMLGGPKKVGDFFGLSTSAVTKWYKPVEQRGCGGVIPSKRIAGLIELARSQGKFLEPNMMFAPPNPSTAKS